MPGLVPPVELAPPPTSVLDASALLAVVRDEPGATIVVRAIADGAAVSVFNWTEVLSVVAAGGDDPRRVPEQLGVHETSGVSVRIESPNSDECIAIARLRPTTKPQRLSLADRACLALASRLGVPALTADRTWADADTGTVVQLIR